MPERKHPYEDIIDLPRPISERYPRMSAQDRAAQFAPFAALTNYEAVIQEAARRTDGRIELSEDRKIMLDQQLQLLAEALPQRPEAEFTYFLPDSRKSGGAYVAAAGRIKKLDHFRRMILLEDGREIPLDDVADIQCQALGRLWEQ